MPQKITSKKFWELYEKLPQELKDTLFAEDTGNNIYEVCQKNEIPEHLEEVVNYIGQVLLGILAPEDFQKTLEKEVGLEKDKAKKVAQEINRFIFYPVKPSLEQLYKLEITPTEKAAGEVKPAVGAKPEVKPTEEVEEKPETPFKKDTYREPIE